MEEDEYEHSVDNNNDDQFETDDFTILLCIGTSSSTINHNNTTCTKWHNAIGVNIDNTNSIDNTDGIEKNDEKEFDIS
jgi:hypothetical protein